MDHMLPARRAMSSMKGSGSDQQWQRFKKGSQALQGAATVWLPKACDMQQFKPR
jgi:hypothetical protein